MVLFYCESACYYSKFIDLYTVMLAYWPICQTLFPRSQLYGPFTVLLQKSIGKLSNFVPPLLSAWRIGTKLALTKKCAREVYRYAKIAHRRMGGGGGGDGKELREKTIDQDRRKGRAAQRAIRGWPGGGGGGECRIVFHIGQSMTREKETDYRIGPEGIFLNSTIGQFFSVHYSTQLHQRVPFLRFYTVSWWIREIKLCIAPA
jgi:hypothetical protein